MYIVYYTEINKKKKKDINSKRINEKNKLFIGLVLFNIFPSHRYLRISLLFW